MAEATAVIVAGEEDFGLVTVEAQASGRPPVAFASGGSLEIIEDGTTGFLFDAQTPESVAAAMQRAASTPLDAWSLRASAERFDIERFYERFGAAVEQARERCSTLRTSVSVQG
jgi:glycosyltransferase involved in cell wall biosynthesis